MKLPTANELLQVWETGTAQTTLQKSLCLLAVACAAPVDEIALLSIGERDARLLFLRECLFGATLVNVAYCPSCVQPVEWETSVKDIRLQTPAAAGKVQEYNLQTAGYHLRFRLPNSFDVLHAAPESNDAAAPAKLLAACIVAAHHEEQPYDAASLPDAVLQELSRRMEQEDPQADIQMLINCPWCACSWQAPFDICSYLCTEIDGWARNLFQEVYVLASAFGWSEQDILNMSAKRRQVYLEMLQ